MCLLYKWMAIIHVDDDPPVWDGFRPFNILQEKYKNIDNLFILQVDGHHPCRS